MYNNFVVDLLYYKPLKFAILIEDYMKKTADVFAPIIERAKESNARIVLPEGFDNRIVKAAELASLQNLCKIIVLGDKVTLETQLNKKALKNITIIDPISETKKREMYANTLYELRKHKGMTVEKALEALKNPITFAMMMLKSDDADGVVAGAVATTAEVLRNAFQIIKTKPGCSKVSSSFIMEMPNDNLGENGFMVFGDCAVNENPTDEELADIAIETAATAKSIANINPRVALLNYTTKADENSEVEVVQKIKRAFRIVRRKNPSLAIDGEMQVDAALNPAVCQQKYGKSVIEGKANVLIFPDLVSGNIGYKLVQRIAGVRAIGPILQGLNKPVNDLSRGTTAEEIVLNIAITVLQSKDTIKGV